MVGKQAIRMLLEYFLFTYKSLFCSKMNAASVVVKCEVVETLNHYKMVKKFELCTLRGRGDIKTFQLSLAP